MYYCKLHREYYGLSGSIQVEQTNRLQVGWVLVSNPPVGHDLSIPSSLYIQQFQEYHIKVPLGTVNFLCAEDMVF